MTEGDRRSGMVHDDGLIDQVRNAVRRARADEAHGEPPASGTRQSHAGLVARAVDGRRSSIEEKGQYRLREFTRFQDEEFIENAYRGILRRTPDPSGRDTYLGALRQARLSKPEILGRLRYSAEGRRHAVSIPGLALAFALRTAERVPFVGRIVAIGEYLVRLPELARTNAQVETRLFQLRTELVSALNDLVEHESDARTQQEARLSELRGMLTSAVAATEELGSRVGQRVEAMRVSLGARVHKISAEIRDYVIAHDEEAARMTKQLETGLAGLGNDLTRLKRDLHEYVIAHDEEAARMTKQLARLGDDLTRSKLDLHEFAGSVPKQIEQRLAAAPAERKLPDPLYAVFETTFRGAPDEIKRRLAVYLPSVRDACAATAAGVLDLGCGRGEWLDLLGEHAIPAKGIDINEVVAAQCRARGLDVAIGDALDSVRSQESGSLAAITAFHIVEHLPYSTVISLLTEMHRALRPDGIVIIETPNPENLIVGACNFYFDPTHRSPVPPPLLEFLVTQAGFEASTMRLHPSEVPREFTVDDPFIRNWLFGPQDYAVIGRKRMQSS